MGDEETDEQEEREGGGSRLLLFAAIGLAVVLLGGGVAAYVLLRGNAPIPGVESPTEESAEAEDVQAESIPYFSIEPFVVNIDDDGQDRFLKLKVDLELSSTAVSAELEERLPQIKDIMIGLLSSQSFDDIRSLEGKDFLREELQTRLNAVVRKGTVQQVFFTEFVVQ